MTQISTRIVGNSFRPLPARTLYKELISNPQHGFTIMLEAEPDNSFDPLAIKVLLDLTATCDRCPVDAPIGSPCAFCDNGKIQQREHVGYIPRDETGPIHKLLASEAEFTVTNEPYSSHLLIDFDPSAEERKHK